MSDEAETMLEISIDKLTKAVNRLTDELRRYNDNEDGDEGGAEYADTI